VKRVLKVHAVLRLEGANVETAGEHIRRLAEAARHAGLTLESAQVEPYERPDDALRPTGYGPVDEAPA